MKPVKLSVRKIVELVLRAGDINSGFGDSTAAYLGVAAHRKLQSQAGENYSKEVSLKFNTVVDDIPVLIQGRADGIITEENGDILIDEIKSTKTPLDIFYNQHGEHLAQGKCYAFMYLKTLENPPGSIAVRLTYFHLDTEEIRRHVWTFTDKELEDFFMGMLKKYGIWLRHEIDWKAT